MVSYRLFRGQRIIVGLLMALMLGGLISTKQTPATAQVLPPTAEPCLADDPLQLETLRTHLNNPTPPTGIQRINPSLTVEFVATGELTDTAPLMPEEAPETGDDNPDERNDVPAATARFHVFNTQTLKEFRVVMEAVAVDQIRDCFDANNLNDGTVPEEFANNIDVPAAYAPLLMSGAGAAKNEPAGAVTPGGWSNSSDERVVKTNTKAYPLRTIAQFRGSFANEDSGCSGTLVGPRHLITAAHCINKSGTNTWYGIRVTPAKNGMGSSLAVEPYGASVITTNLPAGQEAWYWTFEQWRDPNQSNRTNWDIGMIVIPNRLGDQTTWMGVAARNSTYLKDRNSYNRGYPNCNGDGLTRGNRPVGCQVAKMYGDPGDCHARWFKSYDSDGWARRYDVRCDLSAGHSGSPVYHYETNSQGTQVAVVSAVVITESCFKCGVLDFYPNTVRRVTPSVIDNYVALREIFP